MTSAKKIYLAVAGGLVAAGVVLAGIGFIASGFDPAVFTTHIDTRDSTIVLGGVEVDDPMGLPLHRAARQSGRDRHLRRRGSRRALGAASRALCPPSCVSRRNPNLNLYATGPKPAPIRSQRRAGPVTHAQKGTRRKERDDDNHALPPSRGHAGPEATGPCGGAVLGLATLIWTVP